ncbi:MAG: FkbM family methyltransferase [Pseudomonadota bacterium]|jgi:FkbM family methyltransferase
MITTYKGYIVREGTLDSYVVDELRTYRMLTLYPHDIVLDVGGNIGSFAKYAAGICHSVVSVEPSPDNFALLEINSPRSLNINAAVVGDNMTQNVFLYENRGKNKGLHSTVPTRGRDVVTVPAVEFAKLLHDYTPTKLKVDCEGAEYSFVVPGELPESVKAVAIEYNLTRKHERGAASAMHQKFLESGFACLKFPTLHTKAWATLSFYERA